MKFNRSFLLATVALLAGTCHAQTSPWSAYVGVGHIKFHPSTSVEAGGGPVPGADARASSNDGVAFGLIYAFSPDWSAELALGVPPTTTLTAAGTLEGAGTLGRVKYGPAVLSVRRALPALGPLRPYLGAGINYTVVLATPDGFIQNLDVKNAWGPVAQAGLQWPLGGPWSLNFDVKKVWAKTTATGTLPALGGVDARAKIRLDPVITALTVARTF